MSIVYMIIGLIFGRWIIGILDSLCELLTMYITKIYTKINIDIHTMSESIEQCNTQLIGFHADEPQPQCDCDDEDCDCEGRQIGFRK